MAGFAYADWLSHMLTIMQVSDPDGQTAFTALAPYFIDRGERLIYSDPELDFLVTRDVDVTQITTNGRRAVPIAASLIIVEYVNLILPANTLPTSTDTILRVPYRRSTRPEIDFAWPYEAMTATPDPINGGQFAIFDMQQASPAPGEDEPTPLPSALILMPTPDNSYYVEQLGIYRPAPLSASNTTTFLTSFYYPLFLAATVQIAVGYQRDFGAQVNNPQMAMSWKAEYEFQRESVKAESQRQKSLMGGYSPMVMPVKGMVAQAIAGAPPQGA